MEKCPWCGAVQEKTLFEKSDEDGAVVHVECESCNRPIKVMLKVVESYEISLPDKVAKKLRTIGQRVKKNPRWDWCICHALRSNGEECLCKTGTFEVKEAQKSERAGSGYFVTVSNENGVLEHMDSYYFLPIEEEVA